MKLPEEKKQLIVHFDKMADSQSLQHLTTTVLIEILIGHSTLSD